MKIYLFFIVTQISYVNGAQYKDKLTQCIKKPNTTLHKSQTSAGKLLDGPSLLLAVALFLEQQNNKDSSKTIANNEKPFKCETCSKCFGQPRGLAKHKKIHTGERPFKCDICFNCFAQLSTLQTHKITHTGEKTFKCDACGKSHNSSGSLKYHKTNICGKDFTRIISL